MRRFFGLDRDGCLRKSVEMNDRQGVTVEPLESRVLLSGMHYVVDSLLDIVADDEVTTLREAIEAANNDYLPPVAETSLITFDESLAGGVINLTGGQLDIYCNVEIEGLGADSLTIDCNDTGRAFFILHGLNVGISALTITRGNVSDGGGIAMGGGIYNIGNLVLTDVNLSTNNGGVYGGSIYNGSGDLTLIDSRVMGNRAEHGGGIYNHSGKLTLTNSVVIDNEAFDGHGGGIWNEGRVTLTDSALLSNTAQGSGGGIFTQNNTLIVTDSVVSRNMSLKNRGGGIYAEDGVLTITRSEISYNSADDNAGGIWTFNNTGILKDSRVTGNSSTKSGCGIYNQEGSLSITGSTISDNFRTQNDYSYTGTSGGGIYNASDLVIIDSVIANNSTLLQKSDYFDTKASMAGGIMHGGGSLRMINVDVISNSADICGGLLVNTALEAVLINVNISGNQATRPGVGYGGGIVNRGYLSLINCLISENHAQTNGGGIDSTTHTRGVLKLTNTTIAGNSSHNGGGIMCRGITPVINNSIIAMNHAPSYAVDLFVSYEGSNNLISVNPQFVRNPLPGADGQWGTKDDVAGDYHLLSGSPAIDAGRWGDGIPLEDIDGHERYDDRFVEDTGQGLITFVDIGAYEANYSMVTPNGDFTGDHVVGLLDLQVLGENWAMHQGASKSDGDANGDGMVDLLDLDILGRTWGATGMIAGGLNNQPAVLDQPNASNGTTVDWWQIELEEEEVVLF